MGLPDPESSRAVLVGTDTYRVLPPLPAVANNLRRLESLLTDPNVWGLPKDHCTILRNPASMDDVLDAVHEAARSASDTLMVYFAGHGLLAEQTSDLYLALPDASLERLYKAVRYDDIRRAVLDARQAQGKVVILDCCYSGQAMLGGMSAATEVADQVRIDGTYLMTASAETKLAWAPVDEEYTAFTGELINVLAHGLPDGPDLLDVETLYWHVRRELEAKGRPVPQQRARNEGAGIVLARNRRGASAGHAAAPRSERPAMTAMALPEIPPGLEASVRRPPREFLASVASLQESDRAEDASQLMAAAAARRPDQEVAAIIIGLLRQTGREAEAGTMIQAAARRPAREIVALTDALRETGWEQDACQVIEAAAVGPPEAVAVLAEALRTAGQQADVARLLDAAVSAQRETGRVIALVAALWSAGLGDETDRMLEIAAASLSSEEGVALADALREAGREDDAFRLYAAAPEAVAKRKPDEIVPLLSAMRLSGRSDDADRLLSVVIGAQGTVPGVLELARALLAAGLQGDVERLLDDAATQLDDVHVVELADALRDADQPDAAFVLYTRAAGRRAIERTMSFVDALRAAGRPVDSNRLLEAAGQRRPAEVAVLAAGLADAGRDLDLRRLLATAARRPGAGAARLVV